MPFRLIGIIILLVIVALFTGFNLSNTSDVWVFHTFKDVPVVITVFASFIAGVLITLPCCFKARSRRQADKSPDKSSYKKSEKKFKKKKGSGDKVEVPAPLASDPNYGL